MINILRYRELLIELMQQVNEGSKDVQVDGVVIAVREGHMQKKLRDRQGIYLCANYPDGVTRGEVDCNVCSNQVLLFLLEKVSAGKHDDEGELLHYEKMQQLMKLLKDAILQNTGFCGELEVESGMLVEWEYDTFGGWSGLSIGFKLSDYD